MNFCWFWALIFVDFFRWVSNWWTELWVFSLVSILIIFEVKTCFDEFSCFDLSKIWWIYVLDVVLDDQWLNIKRSSWNFRLLDQLCPVGIANWILIMEKSIHKNWIFVLNLICDYHFSISGDKESIWYSFVLWLSLFCLIVSLVVVLLLSWIPNVKVPIKCSSSDFCIEVSVFLVFLLVPFIMKWNRRRLWYLMMWF